MQDVWREPSQYVTQPGSSVPVRKRPLIYVYDLPAAYNARMLQYNLAGGSCSWRTFGHGRDHVFGQSHYVTETYFHETLLTSFYRTLDPEEADFFYMPIYSSCYMWPIMGWADGPWWHAPVTWPRPMHLTNMYLEAKRWVEQHYPYWSRRGGRDHIFFMTHDEGACYMPTELYTNATVLSHWGRTELDHKSGTAYPPDNYTLQQDNYPQHQPGDWRDLHKVHPCYTPGKDLLVPAMKSLNHFKASPLLGSPPLVRDILCLLKGDVGMHREWWYSRGIRQSLYRLAMEDKWREKYNIIVGTPTQYPGDYSTALARSTFCLVTPGDGWSARSEDAILHGCIPVLLADQVEPVFHGILNWEDFSIRIPQARLHELPDILLAVPQQRIAAMQHAISGVWHRFAYVSGPLLQRTVVDIINQDHVAASRNRVQLRPDHPYRPAHRFPFRNDAFHTIMHWLHSRIPYARGEEA